MLACLLADGLTISCPVPRVCCWCSAAAEAQAAFWLGRGLSREQVAQMLERWPKVRSFRVHAALVGSLVVFWCPVFI